EWWADTYPYSNGYTDSYTNTYSNADTNLNPYANCYAHRHTQADTTSTATPTPIPPTSLVAAYNFNEGSGTIVNDASGNGNNGTISGATWTTSGKYGNALSFNGSNSRVTVPDSSSLHLTTG